MAIGPLLGSAYRDTAASHHHVRHGMSSRSPTDTGFRRAKHALRGVLAHTTINRAVTAAVKPWAPLMSARTLLRVPVTRVVSVESPYCDGPVLLDAAGTDPIASMLYWHGSEGWEPETLAVFLQLVRPGMTVLDVGANTGLFSLLAARRSPTTVVHAFEPVPRVFAMLEANVARNRLGNVACHRVALSDTTGAVPMYVPAGDVPVMASLLADWRPGSESIEVDSKTVDQFVSEVGVGAVDVVKIDTEGTEHAVLAGARRTLASDQPFVICEVLSVGDNAAAITEQLLAADYLFFLLAEGGPRPAERIVGNPIDGCHNYLFVPRSRLQQARDLLHLAY